MRSNIIQGCWLRPYRRVSRFAHFHVAELSRKDWEAFAYHLKCAAAGDTGLYMRLAAHPMYTSIGTGCPPKKEHRMLMHSDRWMVELLVKYFREYFLKTDGQSMWALTRLERYRKLEGMLS